MKTTEQKTGPSMRFTSKCKYCGEVVSALGWKAFQAECTLHYQSMHKAEARAARKAGK